MNIRGLVIIVSLVLVMLVGACDATIHEYPMPERSLVIVRPHVDRQPPLSYKEVVYDEKWNCTVRDLEETAAQLYVPEEDYELRIILDIYRGKPDKRNGYIQSREERRIVLTDKDALPPQDTVHFYLSDGDYYVLGWADYVYKGNPVDWHYHTDVLTNIRTDISTFPSNTHHCSSAAGQEKFTIDFGYSQNGYPVLNNNVISSRIVPVMMQRPMGRYRVVATDYEDFIQTRGSLEGLTVKVVYKQYVSIGYNVMTQEPNLFITTYSFNIVPAQITYEGKEQASLFGDYLFTSYGNETNIQADFYFFDASGNEISHCQNIKIPLKRNHETVVKGFFLTREVGKGNNVAIDDNFEGDYVVGID